MIRSLDVSKIIQPCSQHPEREITVYCKDCGVVCCIECVEEKHERHAIITVEKKYIEREDELNEMLNNIDKSTLTDLRSNVNELREKLGLRETEFEAIKQEIETFREELKTTVDKSCDKLLGEVEQKENEMRSVIESVIRNVENQIRANENFISVCSGRIREGGLGLISCNTGYPPSHDQSVQEIQNYKPYFSPGRDLFDLIAKYIGKIEMKCVEIKHAATVESVTVDSKGKLDDTCTLRHRATNAAELEGDASDTSGTPVDIEGKVKVSREKLSSLKSQVLGSFQIKINCRIITAVGKGTAWIGNRYSNTINRYDENGKIVSSIGVTSGVRGLAMKRSGDVIVCSDDQKIRLVTGSGKVSTLTGTSPFTPQ